MLARNPVNALGAFQAQERALQSLLAFPSPFVRLHMFTHSTDTALHTHNQSINLKQNQPKGVKMDA